MISAAFQTISPDQVPVVSALPADAFVLVQTEGGPLQRIAHSSLLSKLISAGLVKPNEASLQADLAHDENVVALVENDPAPLKNGWWRKVGASGAGNWVQFEQLAKAVREDMEGTVGRSEVVSKLTSGFSSWADLQAFVPQTIAGDKTAVAVSDAGTHGMNPGDVGIDGSLLNWGGQTPNAGRYENAGGVMVRIGNTDGQFSKAQADRAEGIARDMTFTGLQGRAAMFASRMAVRAANDPEASQSAVVTGRNGGAFTFLSGDHSAEVATDPLGGVFMAPNAAPTGIAGAWLMSASSTKMIEDFEGIVGDGVTDVAPKLQQALITMAALYPNGFTLTAEKGKKFRLGSRVWLPSNCKLVGIYWVGAGLVDFFTINLDVTAANALTQFARNIVIRDCDFEAETQGGVRACYGVNVRNIWFTDNRLANCSGLSIRHAVTTTGRYNSSVGGSTTVDPAVQAGFSETDPEYGLSDNLFFTGNKADNLRPGPMLFRFEFARTVVVSNNIGLRCGISWWGGGAPANEGGMPDMLRRVRHVTISNNYLEGGNGGIYGNNGEHMTITGNVVKNVTDTGIDLEGCKNCTVMGNISHNAGNFCMSVFYCAFNVTFANNVCLQDGTGTNISDNLYGGAQKIGAQLGTALFAMVSGSSNLADGIQLRMINNTFSWIGPTSKYGRISMGYGRVEYIGNYFHNVTGNYDNTLALTPIVTGNKHRFTYALSTGVGVDLFKFQSASSRNCLVNDNEVVIAAEMPAGTRAMYLAFAAFSNSVTTVERNRITFETGGSLPNAGIGSSMVINGEPSSTIYKSRWMVRHNVVPDITDISPPTRSAICINDNTNERGEPVPSLSSAAIERFNFARHSRIRTASPSAQGVSAKLATLDGCSAPATSRWTAGAEGALGQYVWWGGNWYQVTAAGTFDAANGPTGTGSSIVNGMATLAYRGGVSTFAIESFGPPQAASTATTGANMAVDIDNFSSFARTAQSSGLAIDAPTGTPFDGQTIRFRLKDNGTARAINWNGAYRAIGVALPAATVAGKLTYVTAAYNAADAVWDVTSVLTQA